jgi:S-formylglutathione hydrolase FrmB
MRESVKGVVAALACALTITMAPGGAGTASGAETTDHHRLFASDGVDRVQAARNLVEMNLIPSVDTGYVPVTNPPGSDAKACPAPRCRDHRLRRPAGVSVTEPVVRVILPVDYATRTRTRFPVVYLFNGALSPYHRWSRQTMLTAMSRRMDAIFVMPEGGHKENAGYFTDWKDGSFDWETWHVDHLVPWVDRTFRTMRGARVAVGASMGAQGALTYAARHPGLFRSVLSISGLLDTGSLVAQGLPTQSLPPLGTEVAALKKPDLRRIWGDPVLDKATWAEHNPMDQVAALRGVDLFFAAGTGFAHYDPTDEIHSGIVEMNLWNQHRQFFTRLTAEGIPYRARVAVGQFHDWPYFHEAMRWGLPRAIAAARS